MLHMRIGTDNRNFIKAPGCQNPNLAPDVRVFIQDKNNSMSNYIRIIEEMFAQYGGIN